jgi:hypothetical protein
MYRTIAQGPPVLCKAFIHQMTTASFHESIVSTIKAGLLACNIFTVLPIRRLADSG